MASTGFATTQASLTNYVAYHDPLTGRSRVGHYDFIKETLEPLCFTSGTFIDNLYQVIEVGESNIISSGDSIPITSVRVLPPLTSRDVLCVGKNYAEHAKEFNSSGFDSSDKVDQPSDPVIFTKRFTSIIADGEEIYPHPDFTQTLDYEGEIGVIIGKPGFRISEAEAMSHVWGYTIINDVTARERQRDHKQFYIGKSADTFCPMGPMAVPASKLEQVLRVQTRVNGELRQNATTDDLIFSIPRLIRTMSEGQTLMPGDVLATGTPAGVGLGLKPPVYLKPGDIIAVSVTGLGTLTNRVARLDSNNPVVARVESMSSLSHNDTAKKTNNSSLTIINKKPLHYEALSNITQKHVVFVHGLGGTNDHFLPLIHTLKLEQSHSLHLFDFEGHGLSPTLPLSKLTVESLAMDLNGVFEHAKIPSGATLIAQDMGCLIAIQFILRHPDKASKLVLLSPPASPLSNANSQSLYTYAKIARTDGMSAVSAIADGNTTTGTVSQKTKTSNSLAILTLKLSLVSQNPDGYAKACTAFAEAPKLDIAAIQSETLIITGSEDVTSSPDVCAAYSNAMRGRTRVHIMNDVGHWAILENTSGVADIVADFLEVDIN